MAAFLCLKQANCEGAPIGMRNPAIPTKIVLPHPDQIFPLNPHLFRGPKARSTFFLIPTYKVPHLVRSVQCWSRQWAHGAENRSFSAIFLIAHREGVYAGILTNGACRIWGRRHSQCARTKREACWTAQCARPGNEIQKSWSLFTRLCRLFTSPSRPNFARHEVWRSSPWLSCPKSRR